MDWPAFHAVNPKLVMLQITGYGADTSMRTLQASDTWAKQ